LWPRSGAAAPQARSMGLARRHLPEGLRGAQGAFRGGISAFSGAPLRRYHPLVVGAPIWSTPHLRPTGDSGQHAICAYAPLATHREQPQAYETGSLRAKRH
jgi:hypothetical protein